MPFSYGAFIIGEPSAAPPIRVQVGIEGIRLRMLLSATLTSLGKSP